MYFEGVVIFSFPPRFKQTTHSPSLQKASRNNPRPHFLNWMKNDVTSVRLCLSSFCKKTIVYYYTVNSIHQIETISFKGPLVQADAFSCCIWGIWGIWGYCLATSIFQEHTQVMPHACQLKLSHNLTHLKFLEKNTFHVGRCVDGP